MVFGRGFEPRRLHHKTKGLPQAAFLFLNRSIWGEKARGGFDKLAGKPAWTAKWLPEG